MNDLETQAIADIHSPELKPAVKPVAPEVQDFSASGVTLVEENLETGDSWFILGPSNMTKIRKPLIGGRGRRPAVDPEYRDLLEHALDEVGNRQLARCISTDEGREVWVEAQTVRFYRGAQGEPMRLIVVRNCSAEYEARTLNQKAIDRGLNHFQANLLVENLTTKSGRYIVRHARQSHEQRPLCGEHRIEKMIPEERQAFLEGASKVGGSAEYQWLMPDGHREWFRMINLGESVNECGEVERLLMGYCIEDEKKREADLQQQLKQMDELNQRLNTVAETARVGYMLSDYRSGRLELSPMAQELLDLPVDEYPEPTFEDYIARVHPAEREISLGRRGQIATGQPHNMRVGRFVWRDGSVHHLKLNFKPRYDGARYLGADAVLVDVSDVQRANARVKQEKAALERATSAAEIGTFTYLPDRNRVTLNDTARRLVQLPVQQFPKLNLTTYMGAFELDDTEAVLKEIQWRVETGVQHQCVERQVRLADGALRYLEIHIERYTSPAGVLSLEGVMLDVTERVQREQQMREEQQRREQMFAVIGHELRTPAATLKMLAEQLESSTQQSTPHEFQQTQQMLKSTAEHLLTVLDDLRQVAQPDTARSRELKVVQLPDFLEGVVNSLRPLAQSQNFNLIWELQRADFQWAELEVSSIRQVLTNLTKNALIHSGGDRVRVALEMIRSEEKRGILRLRVLDNGQGIPSDQVEQLFTPFVRGNTEAEGTGLGLPICRDLIRALGGELCHETTPCGGSSFNLELPIVEAEPESQSQGSGQESNPFAGKRILVAEDNLTIRMLTQKMLESKGAELVCAENGHLALEQFDQSTFDLVLSDIFMPQVNGYEFVSAIRNRGFEGPVVGLTAATIGEETERMMQAGADLIIPKPINIRKLADWLNGSS